MSKKSLTINATRNGKKVSKSLGFINPDVANSLVGGFAQMVNALSNDTFVNAEVVKKMDTTEEDTGGGTTPAPAGLLDPNIRWGQVLIGGVEYEGYTWDGNGDAFIFSVHNGGSEQIDFNLYDKGDTPVIYDVSNFILVKSDGTYATSWKRFDY